MTMKANKPNDGAKLSDYGNTVSYMAIPYPIPEGFRQELIAAGRSHGEAPAGDIATIIRIEGTLRSLFGQRITRSTIKTKATV